MIKDFKSQYAQLLLFYGAFGICFGLPRLFSGRWVEVTFPMEEYGDLWTTVALSLKDLVDLVLIGPVFSLVAWRIYQLAKAQAVVPDHRARWDYLYVFNIALLNVGNTMHVIANRFNNWTHALGGLEETRLYGGLYFYDEFVSHPLIVLPVYGMALVLLHFQLREQMSYRLDWDRWLYIILMAVGFGIGCSLTMMEGQANPIFIVVNVGFLGWALWSLRRGKEYWLDRPVMLFVLLEAIAFLVTSLVYGLMFGVRPYYPFFRQPNVLGY